VQQGDSSIATDCRAKIGVVGSDQGCVIRVVEQSLDSVAGVPVDASPVGTGATSVSLDSINPYAPTQFNIAESSFGVLGDDMDFMSTGGQKIGDLRSVAVGASIDIGMISRAEKNEPHQLLSLAAQQ
jgi:hypothetical protein